MPMQGVEPILGQGAAVVIWELQGSQYYIFY